MKSRASRDGTERKRVKSLRVGRLSVQVLKKLLPSTPQCVLEPQRYIHGRAGRAFLNSLKIRAVNLGCLAKLLLGEALMRPQTIDILTELLAGRHPERE